MTSSFVRREMLPPRPECRLEGGDKHPRGGVEWSGVEFPPESFLCLTEQLMARLDL